MRYLFYFIFYLLSIQYLDAEIIIKNDVIQIGKNFKDERIGQSLFYIKDTARTISFEELKKNGHLLFKNKFPQKEILLGFDPNDYWFTFSAQNTSKEPLLFYLSLANPNTDEIEVYFVSNTDTLLFSPIGDNFLFPNSSFAARNFAFPLPFPALGKGQVYIKISRQFEPIEIPIFLSSESFYFKRAKNDSFYLGVFTGLFFMFLLFLICLYFFSKNNVFLYYVGLNLIIFLFYLTQTGFGFQYIWPNFPIVQKIMPSFTVFGFLLFTTFFLKNFYNLAIRFSRFNTLFNLINLILILSFVFNFVYSFSFFERALPFQISFYILNVILIIYGLLFLVLILYTWLKLKRKDVLWAFTGPFLHIVKNVALVLMNSKIVAFFVPNNNLYDLNLVKTHVFLPNILFFVDFGQIVFISIVLANYFRKINNEYIFSLRKLSSMQVDSINATVEGQEKERQKLILEIDSEVKSEILMLKKKVNIAMHVVKEKNEKAVMFELEQDLSKLEQELNNLSLDKLPFALDKGDFEASIHEVFLVLEKNSISNLKFKCELNQELKMTNFEKTNIYRIAQELVSNIIKHANANLVEVKMKNENGNFYFEVSDDGNGFNEADLTAFDGIGLPNLMSRVKGLNGHFDLNTKKGEGTKLKIVFPLKNRNFLGK